MTALKKESERQQAERQQAVLAEQLLALEPPEPPRAATLAEQQAAFAKRLLEMAALAPPEGLGTATPAGRQAVVAALMQAFDLCARAHEPLPESWLPLIARLHPLQVSRAVARSELSMRLHTRRAIRAVRGRSVHVCSLSNAWVRRGDLMRCRPRLGKFFQLLDEQALLVLRPLNQPLPWMWRWAWWAYLTWNWPIPIREQAQRYTAAAFRSPLLSVLGEQDALDPVAVPGVVVCRPGLDVEVREARIEYQGGHWHVVQSGREVLPGEVVGSSKFFGPACQAVRALYLGAWRRVRAPRDFIGPPVAVPVLPDDRQPYRQAWQAWHAFLAADDEGEIARPVRDELHRRVAGVDLDDVPQDVIERQLVASFDAVALAHTDGGEKYIRLDCVPPGDIKATAQRRPVKAALPADGYTCLRRRDPTSE